MQVQASASRVVSGPLTDGNLLVLYGPHDSFANHHQSVFMPAEWHAYDMVAVEEGVATLDPAHWDDPTPPLTAFYGFGQSVYAPADGVLERAVDGIDDEPIGANNTHTPYGNHVVMRHDDDSRTLIAHLKNGSVAQALRGQQISAGTEIGQIGNSGNSSGPHIHIQRWVHAEDPFSANAVGALLAMEGVEVLRYHQWRADGSEGGWSFDTEPSHVGVVPDEPFIPVRGHVIRPAAAS